MNEDTLNIAIDIGNSFIKVGLFRAGLLKEDWIFQDLDDAIHMVKKHCPSHIIASSVTGNENKVIDRLPDHKIFILDASTPIPFENHYKTKSTLGVDRIAALAGAECINKGKNNLVIDIGSCITYDFLDKNGLYHGGSISPGVDLRFKSMNDYTKKLPLISKYDSATLIGQTTEQAMVSGVINGISAEIDGIISRYQSKWSDLEVIMCGRAANSFESKLKATIFASPKLVLIGLNRILEYNEKS
ncbi:type III pantothenate kinase [Reichenbachiella sp.]|uniref:type III pantothenate kinase n=1 Tax=Reichenbachiella sp. TaxID=2184521 RepID=UPI003BB129BF